ncbi:MAG TPA: hypothetical protein VMG32_05160 [Anaeromyxobacteraceae bacterium]|nr:hypothetical protein [Anaeromyxobacteraceae bacterium]
MPADRVTSADLAAWRRALAEEGDGEHLDPTTAQGIAPRLMAEVEVLWGELERARSAVRRHTLREAAAVLGRQLEGLARVGSPGMAGHGCSLCHDSEARRFATTLRGMAEADGQPRH